LYDDQDKALAWNRVKAEACPTCGTFDDEWLDPETKRYLDPPPYEVVRHTCPGCMSMDEEREGIEQEKADTRGLMLRLHRWDPLEHDY
jgi:hypothetical protein